MTSPTHSVLIALTLGVVLLHAPVVNASAGTNLSRVAHMNVSARQQWVYTYSERGCRYANQMRASRGVHPLYFSALLTRLGARHSNWMASTRVFRHQNLRGLGGYVGSHWLPVSAENIAMSSPRSSDASWDAHEQWVRSAPHFHNMMSRSHTHCGVGIAFDRSGRWWATQLFGRNYQFGHEGGSGSAVSPARAAPPPPSAPPSAPAPARAPAPAAAPARTPTQAAGGAQPSRSAPDVNSDVTFEASNPGNSRDFSVQNGRQR